MLFKHADLGEYVLVKGLRSIDCVIADMVLDNDNGIVKSSLRIKADDVPQSWSAHGQDAIVAAHIRPMDPL